MHRGGRAFAGLVLVDVALDVGLVRELGGGRVRRGPGARARPGAAAIAARAVLSSVWCWSEVALDVLVASVELLEVAVDMGLVRELGRGPGAVTIAAAAVLPQSRWWSRSRSASWSLDGSPACPR